MNDAGQYRDGNDMQRDGWAISVSDSYEEYLLHRAMTGDEPSPKRFFDAVKQLQRGRDELSRIFRNGTYGSVMP